MADLPALVNAAFHSARRNIRLLGKAPVILTAYKAGTPRLCILPRHDDENGRVMVLEGASLLLGHLEADAYTVVGGAWRWHPARAGERKEVLIVGARDRQAQLVEAREVNRNRNGAVSGLRPFPLLGWAPFGSRLMDLLPGPPRIAEERRQRAGLAAAVLPQAVPVEGIPTLGLHADVVAHILAGED